MKKFIFRLEKVLDYRAMAEQWAKDAFLEAKINTVECEAQIGAILAHRKELLCEPIGTLFEHRAIETALQKSDDDERAQYAALEVLKDEEEAALEAWKVKRQEVEALKRLKEQAYGDWQKDANREEQAQLDEWTTQRRAA